MTRIDEFVLDRLDEEEFLARHMIRRHGSRYLTAAMGSTAALSPSNPWHVLDTCAERRRLVAAEADAATAPEGPSDALRDLAAVWAHHPAFCASWAPRARVPRQPSLV